MSIINKLQEMRRFYEAGNTRSYAFRKEQLLKLKKAVVAHEQDIYAALAADLKKSPEESFVTENGFLLSEIKYAIHHLFEWMQPQKVSTNLMNLPSKSFVLQEPLGVVMIIGPWNYPLQLLFTPLVGAMAAGNCIMLKASEFAPATAAVMKNIIEENFNPAYILFNDEDGATVIPAMMKEFVFDHVFYTGSTAVGKIIYKMAAENLVPVTLELGGKSPCIVEADAAIDVAAKRIAIAKFSNAGQMCVAPDYILVHQSVKEKLVAAIKKNVLAFFGEDAKASASYGKIINTKQFDRIIQYLKDGKIVHGGNYDRNTLYIEPTIIDEVSLDSALMNDEIFGPVLPVIVFNEMTEALNIVARHKNPLAFYVYTSSSKKEKEWLNAVSFGGGCVNNCSWHLTNHHLPFGGKGFSGTGHYHGKYSFDTFSHKKSIMKTPAWFDPSIKYPPLKGKLKFFKWITG